jgi:hypothetical protein
MLDFVLQILSCNSFTTLPRYYRREILSEAVSGPYSSYPSRGTPLLSSENNVSFFGVIRKEFSTTSLRAISQRLLMVLSGD